MALKMPSLPGIGSKSNYGIDKSKNSTNTAATDNSNVSANDSSSVAILGDGASMLDGGAIQSAFTYAAQASEQAMSGMTNLTAGILGKTSLDSGERVQKTVTGLAIAAAVALGLYWYTKGSK